MVESSWNVMAHGDAREGKWRGNWWMEWVPRTLHTTLKHGVSSITTADAHTSAASSRLNWCPRRFKWTRPFRRKTKSGFCACAIKLQTQSNITYIFMFCFIQCSVGQSSDMNWYGIAWNTDEHATPPCTVDSWIASLFLLMFVTALDTNIIFIPRPSVCCVVWQI